MENQQLTTITNEGKEIPVIDSREVATMLDKEHKYIIREIEGSKDGKTVGIIPTLLGANFALNNYFIESTYLDPLNRAKKCYLVTKMGCELLGNKQQGEKGILFSARYVERFNAMEEQLRTSTPQLPTSYLDALKALVASEEEKAKLLSDNTHKGKVIEGLTEDIPLADKRQRISQIVRYGSTNYQQRYGLLYQEFDKLYHMDVKRRLKNGQEAGTIKKSVKPMDYICGEKYLNMTSELFEVCCKLFETSWESLLKDIQATRE